MMRTPRQSPAPTLFERSRSGRRSAVGAPIDVPATALPNELVRHDNGLPELSELDVVRHYLTLAQRNYGVDSGFYPLGSCTMKYNPKINEELARLDRFADSHPRQPASSVQGNLQLMYELQQWLSEIGGFDTVSLQPSAGAHGELTALLMIRAYFADRGDTARDRVLVPDAAHGTNPASTAMAGYDIVEIPTDRRGNVDRNALLSACNRNVAALMLTNPNTLGLFDEHLCEITRLVHKCGGFVYGDGANMNALTGVMRPAHGGIDLMHFNLHKTFGTPHGGGGPGAGPLAASGALTDYLPGPIVTRQPRHDDGGDETATVSSYGLAYPPHSIGPLSQYYGSFGVFIRAYSYIRGLGAAGLRKNAIHAVLNANYLRARLRDHYKVPFDRISMHEFVCEGQVDDAEIHATDICKRLIDFGFHPPTNYFPLIVKEALMIEPTECESKETLDAFADAMLQIAEEAVADPDVLRQAPQRALVGRVDEVHAARQLKLRENG